jgi:glycosyltransferase involved in cell wall biosynthesis
MIAAFAKLKNEVVREGDIYRLLDHLRATCDGGVLCDDASSDGTAEILRQFVDARRVAGEAWRLLEIPREQHAFSNEIAVKQAMLEGCHELRPEWIWWVDGDEVLDARGTAEFRSFVATLPGHVQAVRFHYTQLWRNTGWARTDDGFDEGGFVKLWRWRPDLAFDVREGLHHAQFPAQLAPHLNPVECPMAPFDVIHYGNVGANLRWKVLQYWPAEASLARHLRFGRQATYRKVSPEVLPPGADVLHGPWPAGFSGAEQERLVSMQGLRRAPGWFTVVMPAFNRARDLPRALESVRAQTYEQWVCVILDDGSTDETRAIVEGFVEQEPRIFYARYPENRGGVAMNELGMTISCEWTEFWTRLGSDDWWEPEKLAYDARAFVAGASVVYGPYVVSRDGRDMELCNPPMSAAEIRAALHGPRGFVGSWANLAVRTSVLEQVRQRYGRFGDPRLRNMDDFLTSSRIARCADYVWRGEVAGEFLMTTDPPALARAQQAWPGYVRWDATWRCVTDGASGNREQTVREDALTRQLVQEENGP